MQEQEQGCNCGNEFRYRGISELRDDEAVRELMIADLEAQERAVRLQKIEQLAEVFTCLYQEIQSDDRRAA